MSLALSSWNKMGRAYANEAAILLVAEHRELTREQLLELNATSFRANFKAYLDMILKDAQEGSGWALEFSDGKYRLKEGLALSLVQQRCRLGADIAFGFYNYQPSFFQGEVSQHS